MFEISNEEAKKIMPLAPKNQELEFVNMNSYKILLNSSANLGTWNLQTCVAIAICINDGTIRYLAHVNIFENGVDKKDFYFVKESLKELTRKIYKFEETKVKIDIISTYSYITELKNEKENDLYKILSEFATSFGFIKPKIHIGFSVLMTPTGKTKILTFDQEQLLKSEQEEQQSKD